MADDKFKWKLWVPSESACAHHVTICGARTNSALVWTEPFYELPQHSVGYHLFTNLAHAIIKVALNISFVG